jgi:hypothetical protein
MNDMVVIWLAGLTITYSILMWWFSTALPVHLLELLRFMGIKRKNADFWSVPLPGGLRNDLAYFTRKDVEEWMQSHLPSKIKELLSCPGCMSAHVSFWTAAALQLFLPQYSLPFFLACWLGWPGAATLVLPKKRALSAGVSPTTTKDSAPSQITDPPPEAAPKKEITALREGGEIVWSSEEAKTNVKKQSYEILRARGILFHEKPDGTISIDHTPLREIIAGKFLSDEPCPQELPGCEDLRARYGQELQAQQDASCFACEENKLREKYRHIVVELLKDIPGMD